jgi:hypothetical protein
MKRLSTLAIALCLVTTTTLTGTAVAAGDVQVSVDRGRLTIAGDEMGNDLQIDKNAADGGFVVTGRNGTTINGAERFLAGPVKVIRADMGAGDDVVAMGGFVLNRSLRIDLGDGDDELSLFRNTIKRRTTLLGGPGSDTIRAEGGTRFMRGVRIATDAGDDLVRIADSEAYGRLVVRTGDDADRVELHRDGFAVLASLDIRTGTGDDWVETIGCTFQGHVKMLTGDGADVVYATTSRFVRPVSVKTGPMDDEIELERATFDAALSVNGGAGVNTVIYVRVNISGGSSSSDKYSWRFVIVHVFP